MLASSRLSEFLRQVEPRLQDVVLELRNLVYLAAPDAVEEIRRYGLVYYHPSGGPVSAGICQILLKPGHVRLAFNHGAFLPHPPGSLEGDGRLIKRYVRIYSFEDAHWEDLKELIFASSRFDPRSLPQDVHLNLRSGKDSVS